MGATTISREAISLSPEVRLLATDYDGTVASTSEPAPNGMTVALSYELAIAGVFGEDALDRYKSLGGLRNRAPAEVVAELMPGTSTADCAQQTEELVAQKLSYILSQVGSQLPDGSLWPRPVKGFVALWRAISLYSSVSRTVISSGHTSFIEKFFEVNDLEPPDGMVTDDTMRPHMSELPVALCVKPSRLLVDLAHAHWLARLGIVVSDDSMRASRKRITYTGDDPVKDGMLAENAGIDFVHIDPRDPAKGWEKLGRLLVPPAQGVAHDT